MVHNIQDIISRGVMSSLFRDVLRIRLDLFSEQLTAICLKYILECIKRNSIHTRTLFDETLEDIYGLLESFEKLMLSNPIEKTQELENMKTIIVITEMTQSIANFEANIKSLSPKAIRDIRKLSREENNMSSQAAALLELVISSLSKVYLKYQENQQNYGNIKPLLYLSGTINGEESNEMLVGLKDYIKKCEQHLELWKNESISNEEFSFQPFMLNSFINNIETKLIEAVGNSQNSSLITLGQYRVLERIYLQVQHIKWLVQIEDLFTEPAHQRLVAILDSRKLQMQIDIYETYGLLKKTIIELAFDQEFYAKIESNGGNKEKLLRILRSWLEHGRTIMIFLEKYKQRIKIDEYYLSVAKELEINVSKEEQTSQEIYEIIGDHGDKYLKLLEFIRYYYVAMREGFGLEEERVQIVRRTVEELLEFERAEREYDALIRKINMYQAARDKQALLGMKRKIQGFARNLKEVRELIGAQAIRRGNEMRLFEEIEDQEKYRRMLMSEQVMRAEACFGQVLKDIENFRK